MNLIYELISGELTVFFNMIRVQDHGSADSPTSRTTQPHRMSPVTASVCSQEVRNTHRAKQTDFHLTDKDKTASSSINHQL